MAEDRRRNINQPDFRDIEWLKNSFSPKTEKGDALPSPRGITDGTVFYLQEADGVYIEHIMFNGAWHKKVIDSASQVTLEEV